MWDAKCLVFLGLWLFAAFAARADGLPVLELNEYASSRDVSQALLRAGDFEGEMTRSELLARLDEFESLKDRRLAVETEIGHSVFLLKVANRSETYGEWIFTSRRHSVNRFTIYDITEETPIILADSRERGDNALNIRRYIGFGEILRLDPGEELLLAVYADIEILRSVPFEFYSVEAYLDEYYWQTSRFAIILPMILILIIINIMFFSFLGRWYFLFLAASELSFLILIMHSAAYVDALGLAMFPIVAIQVAELSKCTFIVFMGLFALNLLDTKSHYPVFHRLLQAMIALGVLLTLFWLAAGFVSKEARVVVRDVTWIYSAGGSGIFPVIGGFAVRRHGIHYIPLVIGWSAVAVMGLYICAYVAFPPLLGLPRVVTLLSIIGFQEAFFVTLSAVWKIWKDKDDQQKTIEAYAIGLEDRLRAISRARELEEAHALAVSTIRDQNAMLQSSGHDTKQVLLAINSATEYLEKSSDTKEEALVDTLKASAAYLDDILSTTLNARRTYTADRTGLALSGFSVEALSRSLERIYRPAFRRQNLAFDLRIAQDVMLVSDRALLMRALSNFIANSLNATQYGGVSFEAQLVNGHVRILIEDSGSGIDEAVLDYLLADDEATVFAPDGQERALSGFRIAKSIIRQLDGELSVMTQIGQGTTIRIDLPCAYRHLNQIDQKQIEAYTDLTIIDLDQSKDTERGSDEPMIGLSFDDSSQMRGRAAEIVDILLYKPVSREVFEHPAVVSLISDRETVPSQ